MNTIIVTAISMLVGGGLAAATVIGVVSSQTGAPDQGGPLSESSVIDYGSDG